jgi:hypothetical protein
MIYADSLYKREKCVLNFGVRLAVFVRFRDISWPGHVMAAHTSKGDK